MVRVRLTSRKTINPVASRLALPAVPGAGSAKAVGLSWARALAQAASRIDFCGDVRGAAESLAFGMEVALP